MAKRPALIEARFRSGLEKEVADQLDDAGVSYAYEAEKLHFTIPAFNAKYTPDFRLGNTNIFIEAKGAFGNGRRTEGTAARQRLLLVREQHPDKDIRIVFERAATKIFKGSKTSQGQWAEDHGFQYSDKGVVPQEWLDEAFRLQKGSSTKS